MRKVLIILFLFILNAMIVLSLQAKVDSRLVVESQFKCRNNSFVDKFLSRFTQQDKFLIVLSRRSSLKDAQYQRGRLQKRFRSVEVLDKLNFSLQLAKKGSEYLVVENNCYEKKEALANVKSLRFFFSIDASIVKLEAKLDNNQIQRRATASISRGHERIYLIEFSNEQ